MPPKFPQPTMTAGYARSMATTLFDVASARARFSSLRDGGFVFLDAPGGSQVPDEVGDAIARTLREASANNGAPYETSKRVEAIYDQARATRPLPQLLGPTT
jgi:selenocysteine lyase/cysteine desulfurase